MPPVRLRRSVPRPQGAQQERRPTACCCGPPEGVMPTRSGPVDRRRHKTRSPRGGRPSLAGYGARPLLQQRTPDESPPHFGGSTRIHHRRSPPKKKTISLLLGARRPTWDDGRRSHAGERGHRGGLPGREEDVEEGEGEDGTAELAEALRRGAEHRVAQRGHEEARRREGPCHGRRRQAVRHGGRLDRVGRCGRRGCARRAVRSRTDRGGRPATASLAADGRWRLGLLSLRWRRRGLPRRHRCGGRGGRRLRRRRLRDGDASSSRGGRGWFFAWPRGRGKRRRRRRRRGELAG
mmetsp:Transcript_4346/g.17611  ORF Transcript_4346/g.17611 Transcript_4346/m.17611 type:complete len:293 (-) Transcript_4346:2547-3425(-)